ncbi:MAG: ZIP family metal transporter [Defluviitaleaceae bacterium]|nr:ZIP family metal transporter [Defluviitaleaceae bacterium]
MNNVLMAILVLALGTWIAAALGAAIVAFFKEKNLTLSRIVMGFAAGVILAVTFFELLYPSMHLAEYLAMPAWVAVPGSFILGFLFIFGLDTFVHKKAHSKKVAGQGGFKYRQSVVLASALSFHNIPEGFTLGLMLGILGSHFNMDELWTILPMVIAVGLHKLPEGSVLSVAWRKEGMGRVKAFFLGQISGFIGFAFGIGGFLLAAGMDDFMPFIMAFAGGAMVWVAVHELIPESQKCECGEKRSSLATIGIILGVMAMLILHTVLPHDHGGHDHSHDHSNSVTDSAQL